MKSTIVALGMSVGILGGCVGTGPENIALLPQAGGEQAAAANECHAALTTPIDREIPNRCDRVYQIALHHARAIRACQGIHFNIPLNPAPMSIQIAPSFEADLLDRIDENRQRFITVTTGKLFTDCFHDGEKAHLHSIANNTLENKD